MKRFFRRTLTTKVEQNVANVASNRQVALGADNRQVALVSCSDKTGLGTLCKHFIEDRNMDILSTGGTYDSLYEWLTLQQRERLFKVEDYVKFPEILRGRVKTLHPMIFGGILANRDLDKLDIKTHNLPDISWVVCNLYPFNQNVIKSTSSNVATSLIDIGGVSLIRAAAKNFKDVHVITSHTQYTDVMSKTFDINDRKKLALEAFRMTCEYDEHIFHYFLDSPPLDNQPLVDKSLQPIDLQPLQTLNDKSTQPSVDKLVDDYTRHYTPVIKLKYGCNPHQSIAKLAKVSNLGLHTYADSSFPLKVLNGNPSYINFLDALRGWQLVKELKSELGVCAAASMKHTSPAGVAIYKVFPKAYNKYMYETLYHVNVPSDEVTSTYIRARNCDPMSSFGDFVALSEKVTVELAQYLKGEVSDGIIAPSYEKEALEILKKKKKNGYVIMEIDSSYEPSPDLLEFREIFGIGFIQSRNNERVTLKDVKTVKDEHVAIDLVLASLVLKYAESNTIACTYNGQLVGLGSGQQSRLHATQLALSKAKLWELRHDPAIRHQLDFKFRDISNRQDRINAEMDYLMNTELKLQGGHDISLASDAFFPFRDNIDYAAKHNVKYIAQPGGSLRDQDVYDACKEHGIQMICHNKRMFTH